MKKQEIKTRKSNISTVRVRHSDSLCKCLAYIVLGSD